MRVNKDITLIRIRQSIELKKLKKRAKREAPKFEKQGNKEVSDYVRKQGEKAKKIREHWDQIAKPARMMRNSFVIAAASPFVINGSIYVAKKLQNKFIAEMAYRDLKRMFK